jgi:LAO/AO transport system kinase
VCSSDLAGFDTILVETVGVGQSEIAVHSMVDFFLLLMLPGAGDELQGIKRGIMEMADLIAITKADGANMTEAEIARTQYRNALRLFPQPPSGWRPEVLTCSALLNTGIREIWMMILEYADLTRGNGYFERRRKEQAVIRMDVTIMEYLKNLFDGNESVKALRPEIERLLSEGRITSYRAAKSLIDNYLREQ